MKLKFKILSTLLAVLMMLGSISFIGILAVGAEDDLTTESGVASYYLKTNVFKTPQEKLNTMTLMIEKHGYQLYVDSRSGEVALVEKATGNFLFSNPYDVASSKGSDQFKSGGSPGTKEQLLMSQIIVQFQENGNSKSLYSFQDAAVKGQISVARIKSGVRVEYTIGREEFRKLVPRWIPADVFDELIRKPLLEAVKSGMMPDGTINSLTENNFYFKQFMSFYQLKDPDLAASGEREAMLKAYPITKEMPIYVFSSDASAREINDQENLIKQYCADTYSFEQMDADHETTGYEATDEEYPVFKMALEYSLDENGLAVRLPCNSLQYNANSYTLENISVLPYMGAGNTKNEGYNFYPDGAGSLFDFSLTKQNSVKASIYGTDYAYHNISGTYEKAIRVPVYGTVATEVIYSYGYNVLDENGVILEEHPKVEVSNTVQTREQIEAFLEGENIQITAPITDRSFKRGYVAIVESGESLGMLETYFAGAISDYATVSNYFNPKPKDAYDIADSISVTSSSTWTVVSNRKYTGDIALRYQLLSDEQIGNAQMAKDSSYTYYEASWLGMAEAYREYLVKKGKLTELTAEDVEADIPLYMEVFGALETQQIVATVPVNMMTPLTTFEDILTMYDELEKEGVDNINFKMTGFANGGMYATIPASLKWERSVGGKAGFKQLIETATGINSAEDDRHIGLFPDFDFAYSSEDTLFDGLNLKKDAIKTIDNRYTSKRMYSATQQKYVSFYQLAISPSRYSKFYEKLMGKYEQYGLNTMSVASLGTALNTDFDEDDPYNREDNKDYTINAFHDLKSAGYSLMTDGGNAYTWEFVDHIINMELDSSQYVKATASVPFLGAVLHGYVQFAGTPLNEEGNAEYAMLKAIENGAGMYFILSYQNTHELKEDESLSQYYSIRYDIWRDDVISYYNTLNDLLSDVQTRRIIDHEFLNHKDGYLTDRVLDQDELEQDLLDRLEQAAQDAKEQEKNEAIDKIAKVAEARLALQRYRASIDEALGDLSVLNDNLETEYVALADALDTLKEHSEKGTLGNQQGKLDQFREDAIEAWYVYERLEYQFAQAEKVITMLEKQIEIVRDAKEGTSADYQYQEAVQLLIDARTYLANLKVAQQSVYAELTEERGVEAAMQSFLADVTGYVTKHNTDNAAAEGFKVLVANLDFAGIKEEGKFVPVVEENEKEVINNNPGDEDPSAKYHINNNTVVAVTYGDINADTHEKTAYKTFILNYNNFAIRVTYNGTVYTVPASGYVVLMAQN